MLEQRAGKPRPYKHLFSFAQALKSRSSLAKTAAARNRVLERHARRRCKIAPMNWVYFDVETERSAEEVGGWRNIEQLGLAVAVSCAMRDDATRDESTNDDLKDADLMGGNKVEPVFKTFRREEVDDLLKELQSADCVVGFNTRGFDFRVLQPFANFDLRALPNFDLMLDLKAIAGFRPGLGNC